jgi:hypothetical protein
VTNQLCHGDKLTNPIKAKKTKPAPCKTPGNPVGTNGVKLSDDTDPEHNAANITNNNIDRLVLLKM